MLFRLYGLLSSGESSKFSTKSVVRDIMCRRPFMTASVPIAVSRTEKSDSNRLPLVTIGQARQAPRDSAE